MLGRSIRLFLIDGSPKGIISAEIVNWTGRVSIVPRLKLPEFIKREEAGKTGIYVLTGNLEDSGEFAAYIGETDDVITRLKGHNSASLGKDFWDHVCVITSKDANLTKAHVKYIESRLISIALQCRRAALENDKQPIYTSLPEADQADMEYFIQQIQLVLPVLGINIFQEQAAKIEQAPYKNTVSENAGAIAKTLDPSILESSFELTQGSLKAYAKIIDGEFVLLQGSKAKIQRQPSDNSAHLLARFIKEGRIRQQAETSEYYDIVENIAFRSPSGASCLVLGRASNGRTEWKVTGSSKTFAEWEDAKTQAAAEYAEVA